MAIQGELGVVMLLYTLLKRGDEISVQNGKICISARSGMAVPDKWLEKNFLELASDLADLKLANILIYDGHSVGKFNGGKYPGLSIFLKCAQSDEHLYSIFNVDMNRARATKYGSRGAPLPKGTFRVGRRSSLVILWKSLRLSLPPRLSSFHDYIGNLKSRLLTYEQRQGNKISSTNLVPLNVMSDEILDALDKLADNEQTIASQLPDKRQTKLPYKETRVAEENKEAHTNFTTCPANYEKSNQKGVYKCLNMIGLRKPVQEQSVEEWLADYDIHLH